MPVEIKRSECQRDTVNRGYYLCELPSAKVWTGIQNSDSGRWMKPKFIFPVIWILWSYSFSSDSSSWRYEDEFKTREECVKAMEPYMASALNLERRSGEGVIYYCFPDTADLRSL
jgi:hypothetical protein